MSIVIVFITAVTITFAQRLRLFGVCISALEVFSECFPIAPPFLNCLAFPDIANGI